MTGKRDTGLQDPREKEIVRSNGPADQEDSLARHARAVRGAAAINPNDRRSRIRYIAGLGPDYIRGETPARLAAVWGLQVNTVEADSSIAWIMIQEQSDPAVDHAVWWHETYDALEKAKDHRALMEQMITAAGLPIRYSDEGEAVGPDWLGVKAHADALGKCHDQILKTVEQIGRASGLLNGKGDKLTINIDSLGKSKEFAALQAALERYAGRCDEKHRAMLKEELGRGEPLTVEANGA